MPLAILHYRYINTLGNLVCCDSFYHSDILCHFHQTSISCLLNFKEPAVTDGSAEGQISSLKIGMQDDQQIGFFFSNL